MTRSWPSATWPSQPNNSHPVAHARLRASSRQAAQSARGRSRRDVDRVDPRRSGHRLSRAPSEGRRGRLRGPLSSDAKEALLKTMAQEEVAELLNNMAPDDRTLFLEELPGEATRELLALLTPAERLGRPVAARLPGNACWSADDASLRRRPRTVDHPGGARLRPGARPGQRDAERDLRRRRARRVIDDIRIREFLLAPRIIGSRT